MVTLKEALADQKRHEKQKRGGGSELEELLAFQLRTAGVETPEREHKFCLDRKWRFDFAWPDRMIAVEVEGGSWVKGAHNRGLHFESDCEKYNEAALSGWTVLRFNTHMVED